MVPDSTLAKEIYALFNNPLPGVPKIESPFFDLLFNAGTVGPEMLKLATDLHYRGFGIIDFPDPEFAERAARIKRDMHSRYDWDRGVDLRVQDAWQFNEDVRAIAASKGL